MASLVVLGMHRSGTSLLAKACSAAGVWAGANEDMLEAQADNPAGFFEHRDLVGLNESLLAELDSSWLSPPASLTPASAWLDDARTLIARLLAEGQGQFLLKDPRLCVTWPAWVSVVDTPLLLYVYRSPLAVARSLQRRNHFSLQFGLELWEYYNRRALLALQQYPFVAVAYESLMQEPSRLRKVLEALAAQGFRCDPQQGILALDSTLQHEQAAAVGDPDTGLLTPQQRGLAELCTAVCEGTSAPELGPDESAELELCRLRLADAAAVLAPLATVRETALALEDAQSLCLERTEERDQSLGQLRLLEREHGRLGQAHATEVNRHKATAEILSALQGEHEALSTAHKNEVDAHAQSMAAHRNLIGLHDALLASHSRLQVNLDAVTVDLEAVKADRDAISTEREALRSERDAVRAERDAVKADRDVLRDKADHLFHRLTESYGSLLAFERAPMGFLQRQLRRVYRWVTLRPRRSNSYDDLLRQARWHFSEFELEPPRRRRGKLHLFGSVVAYLWRNPAASWRSFSWPRLKRALRVFVGSSSADLSVWVNARFPGDEGPAASFDPTQLDASLDKLELDFPSVDSPLVSIIVPVFNDYRVTVNCLRSVLQHSVGVAYEVIVADDCSTDLTESLADRIRGVQVRRSSQNLRFLRNCNQAAKGARGQYLLFLNNDTAVSPGWLDALLAPLDDERVAVVGPKLLFADGSLQEAGGILWRDASAWNFGRGDDPQKPAYNYRREVDYVSGACLMIRHSLWQQLGGFDERYAPAYYEDADLCFAVRQLGFRVVYVPEAVVQHFEGVSNGTDLGSGVKQHQVSNQAVFLDKWRDTLEREHFPNGEQVVYARDRSRHRPCVLVIDHYVPHHDRDAGGRSTQMTIELLLGMGCRVQVMGANFFPHQPYTKRLEAMGVEVLVGESIARGLDAWFCEHAPFIDEIFLHRPHVAEQFLPHLERMQPRPPISYFGHDLHYLRTEREAQLKGDVTLRREADQWRERELAVCRRVDRIYYFSDVEIEALRSQVDPEKLRRIPLYAMRLGTLPDYAPREPQGLLFVGGYNHPPNVDAAIWLVETILPRVRAQFPALQVHLVGSNPPESVECLADEGITVHGYVSDAQLAELYRRVAVAVVPLRYGAGVKGKVIEAVAHNVPVLTTEIGAEGIPEAERVLWIDSTAEGLADELIALFANPQRGKARLGAYAPWLEAHFAASRAARVLAEDIPALRESTPSTAVAHA